MDDHVLFRPNEAPSFRPARGFQRGPAVGRPDQVAHDREPTGLSAAMLEAVLHGVTDGVVVADTAGRFLLFNDAAQRMLGLGARDVPPEQWPETYGCYLPDGSTPYPADQLPLARAIRGETVRDCELVVRPDPRRNGIWLSVNGGPMADAAGTIHGGVIVFRDVSANRSELERLGMLSAAVEQTADCVVITDRNGIIEYVNPAAERVTGFSSDELIGGTPRLFSSKRHPPEFYARMWDALLRGEPFRDTIVNRRKDDSLYLSEQTITSIRDTAGTITHFVSVGKDVTELRKAEERDSKLRLARLVQQRLLPPAPPRECGLEIAGGAIMADATGGDFYDYLPLADGRMGIVVGDVSGHAIDAALVMAEMHAYLRSIASAHTDPGRILALANRVMAGDVPEGQFVTAVFVVIDAASRTCWHASAGHNSGYVFGPDGRLAHTLASTGLPLGLFPEIACETEMRADLAEGSLVVLVTDGVLEAEDPDGAPFGEARTIEVIGDVAGRPASEVVDRLQDAVRRHRGSSAQDDDVTVVACRIGG